MEVRRLVVEHFSYMTKHVDVESEASKLALDADFENDLGYDLDSMEDLRFLQLLEKRFEIVIPQTEEAQFVKNLRQTCDLVRKLILARKPEDVGFLAEHPTAADPT